MPLISNCSMMPAWHQLVSMSGHVEESETARKLQLYATSIYQVHYFVCQLDYISYNSWVSTHSINQNNSYNYVSSKSINCRNSMTADHAQKNFHTISDFTKCCCIAMISHVSSRSNWYWTHAVCNQSCVVVVVVVVVFFFFFF